MSEQMERVTVRVDDALLADVDRLVEEGVYHNKSAAIRDAVDELVAEKRQAAGRRPLATDGGDVE